jgi:hypothetical protein
MSFSCRSSKKRRTVTAESREGRACTVAASTCGDSWHGNALGELRLARSAKQATFEA